MPEHVRTVMKPAYQPVAEARSRTRWSDNTVTAKGLNRGLHLCSQFLLCLESGFGCLIYITDHYNASFSIIAVAIITTTVVVFIPVVVVVFIPVVVVVSAVAVAVLLLLLLVLKKTTTQSEKKISYLFFKCCFVL